MEEKKTEVIRTKEDVQKYLESYKPLVQWKKAQQETLDKINEEFNSLKRYMTKESQESIFELKKFIGKNINKTSQTIECVENQINSVPDNELKLLLTYKYVNFNTWEQIAERMHYSLRWVYELHQRALSAFDVVLKLS